MKWVAAMVGAMALPLSACPKNTPQPTPPTVVAEPEASSLGADIFVRAAGVGGSEDEAYAAAQRALAEAILGDALWADRVELAVHRPGIDPQSSHATPEGFEVQVGLSRSQAAVVLSDFGNESPKVSGPEAWLDPMRAYLRAHLAVHACARRTELFGSECEASDTSEADAELMGLVSNVAVVSTYRDGVPVDAQGHALAAPSVFVSWAGMPMADVPLTVVAPPELGLTQTTIVSDASGVAVVDVPEGVRLLPLRIRLDGAALLGPHGDRVPATEVVVEPRAVGLKRWGLVVGKGEKPNPTPPRDNARAQVVAQMESAGYGGAVPLGEPVEIALLRATGPRRMHEAVALGELMAGNLDVVVIFTYDTRFASRMGGSRVWFQAQGAIEAVDVWTGKSLARVEGKVEADGVGERRADDAARRELSRTLMADLLEALP